MTPIPVAKTDLSHTREANQPPEPAITRRKLSDEVLERLLDLIESGQVQPGDQLPSERDLMTRYGVGRPAVREALQCLEQMGLITISHGERARVVSLTAHSMLDQISRSARHLLSTSPQTLEQLKEARLLFEVGMVRLAAAKCTPEDAATLARAVDRLEGARRDGQAFLAADLAFHEAIACVSGNPIFAAVSKAMLGWLAHFHTELVRQPGAEEITITEHRRIADLIAANDGEGAAAMMSEHLMRASAQYRSSRAGTNAAN